MTITETFPPAPTGARRARLWLECLALFALAPLAAAFLMPPRQAFVTLFAITAVGAVLLALTPGWRWRSLIEGPVIRHWASTLAFAAVTLAATLALTLWLRPHALFWMPNGNPTLWLLILAL